jgi:hypothetical protein
MPRANNKKNKNRKRPALPIDVIASRTRRLPIDVIESRITGLQKNGDGSNVGYSSPNYY